MLWPMLSYKLFFYCKICKAVQIKDYTWGIYVFYLHFCSFIATPLLPSLTNQYFTHIIYNNTVYNDNNNNN